MPDIDPQSSMRIANAARAVHIARATLERAKSFEERQAAQRELDAREKEMIEAAMLVNRGISRVAPSA